MRRLGLVVVAASVVGVVLALGWGAGSGSPNPAAERLSESSGGGWARRRPGRSGLVRRRARRNRRSPPSGWRRSPMPSPVAGSPGPSPRRPIRRPGGSGPALLNPATDDWEPAVAADPNAPYVYLLTTRYGEPEDVPEPLPVAVHRLDPVNGRWRIDLGEQVPLCICRGSKAQYDPTIEVVPNTGAVYSVFLNADRAGGSRRCSPSRPTTGRPGPTRCTSTATCPGRTSRGHDERLRQGRVRLVERPAGRRSLRRPVARLRRDLDAAEARRSPSATTTRTTRACSPTAPSSSPRAASSTAGPRRWAARSGTTPSSRATRAPTWQNVIVAKVPWRGVRRRRLQPRLLHGPDVGRVGRAGHLVFAYEGPTTDQGPQRVYVRRLGRGPDVEQSGAAVGGRRERDRAAAGIRRRRRRPHLVHADRRWRQPRRVERLVPQLTDGGGRWASRPSSSTTPRREPPST